MIREFSIKAKPSNGKARTLFILCMLLAFGLVMISAIIDSYKGIVSMAAVAFLSLAIVIYTKYLASTYFYDITFDSEGTPLLVVRQQTGKRHTTLCRIALFEITKIEQENAKQRREHKTPFDTKKYTYLPSLNPDLSYRITAWGKYEKAEILIEVSEEIASMLSTYSTEAKSYQMIDDEY